jgi:hypothetical protein
MSANKHDLDHLLDQARTKLPGSSDAGIKGELFDVFHEFFNDSDAWAETISMPVVPGSVDYNIVPSSGQIIRLGGVLDPNLVPVPALMPEVGVVHLMNGVNIAQTYQVIVVKNVKFPTDKQSIPDVPDWVLPLFGRTILSGLLGKMKGQLNKSYSDRQGSVFDLAQFKDGIAMAKVATFRRNSIGSQAWNFPQTYRTRNQRGGVSVGNPVQF